MLNWKAKIIILLILLAGLQVGVLWRMHNLNKFVKEDIIMRVGGEKLYYGTYQKLMENPEYKKAQEEILKRTLSEIDNIGKTQPNASAQT